MKSMIKFNLILIIFVHVIDALCPTLSKFDLWLQKYNNKTYPNVKEYLKRLSIWETNMKFIEQHNKKYNEGKVTFMCGMNQFGDLTLDEYKLLLGTRPEDLDSLTKNQRCTTTSSKPTEDYVLFKNLRARSTPTLSIDWRTKGYISPIKNQLGCGGCWAFSTTAALEAAYYLKRGKKVTLSEQQLIDCSRSFGNNGCDGGFMYKALNYVIGNRGINSDVTYPYEEKNGQCRYNPSSMIGGTVIRIINVQKGNESHLTNEITKFPCITVAINANLDTIRFYKSGIFYDPDCDANNINHGVNVVGFDTDPVGGDYYIVRNSWGTTWGEEGYMRLARNRRNLCGIASYASYPVS